MIFSLSTLVIPSTLPYSDHIWRVVLVRLYVWCFWLLSDTIFQQTPWSSSFCNLSTSSFAGSWPIGMKLFCKCIQIQLDLKAQPSIGLSFITKQFNAGGISFYSHPEDKDWAFFIHPSNPQMQNYFVNLIIQTLLELHIYVTFTF